MDQELTSIEAEITTVRNEMRGLQVKLRELERKRELRLQIIDQIKLTGTKECDLNKIFPWSDELKILANKHFGIRELKPNQTAAINAVMQGIDSVIVMPTGAGKSLCYQLPSLLAQHDRSWVRVSNGGLTVVVSPLISLMRDQVAALTAANIGAAMMTSTCSREEQTTTRHRMLSLLDSPSKTGKKKQPVAANKAPGVKKQKNVAIDLSDDDVEVQVETAVPDEDFDFTIPGAPSPSPLRVLFITPERVVKSKQLLSTLEKLYDGGALSLIAVDEAHCLSEWGHSFRPDYRQLRLFRVQFPLVPILALTATATPEVADDIASSLLLGHRGDNIQVLLPDGSWWTRPPHVTLRSPSNRPNLQYKTVRKPAQAGEFASMIKKVVHDVVKEGTAIVYCATRKQAETVAMDLQQVGVSAAAYHADLEDHVRTQVQRRWGHSIKVVVATTAFGLGIHRPDVRAVVHHSAPRSLEGYYQEAGRAGRDGKPALSLVCVDAGDTIKAAGMAAFERSGVRLLRKSAGVLSGVNCIRKVVGEYFGDRGADVSQTCAGQEQCFACAFKDGKLKNTPLGITGDMIGILKNILMQAAEARLSQQKTQGNNAGQFTLIQLATEWRKAIKMGGHDGVLSKPAGEQALQDALVRLFILEFVDLEFGHTAYSTNVYMRIGAQLSKSNVDTGRISEMVETFFISAPTF